MGHFDEAAALHGMVDGAMQGAALSVYLDDAVGEMRAVMPADELAQAVRRGAGMTSAETDEPLGLAEHPRIGLEHGFELGDVACGLALQQSRHDARDLVEVFALIFPNVLGLLGLAPHHA